MALNPYGYGVPNMSNFPDPNDPNDPRNRAGMGAGLGGYNGGYNGGYSNYGYGGGYMPAPQDTAVIVPDDLQMAGQGQGPAQINPYTAQMSQALLQANQPLPTRNFRRERRGSALSAGIGSLLGLLTGNAAVGLGAAGSAMQGYQSGAEERYGQEMGQAMNAQKTAQNEANTYRQMGAQWDTNNNAEARARAAEVGRRVASYPAYLKSLRDTNPHATSQQLGQMAQTYIDQVDQMAGGAGKSGLSLRQLEVKPSEVTATITNPDGTTQGGEPVMQGGGIFPVVDPLEPKNEDMARLRVANSFMENLKTLDPASQQQVLRSSDLNGMGLQIPKRADGTYDISLAQAARPTAATDPAVQKRKEVGVSLAFNRKLFADPQTNPVVRKQVASVIAQQEKFLGIGTGQPLPSDAILPMTPYQDQNNKLRASAQAITVRGQDKTAATAAANRAATNMRAANSNAIQSEGLALRREETKARIAAAAKKPGSLDTEESIRKEIAVISKPGAARTIKVKDENDKEVDKVVYGPSMADTPEGKQYLGTLQNKLYRLQTKGVGGKGTSSLPGVSMKPTAVLPGAAANQRFTPPIVKQQPRHAPTGQYRPYPKTNARPAPKTAPAPAPAPAPKTTKFKSKSGTLTITG